MAREKVTGRQKDISRLLREKKSILKNKVKKIKKKYIHQMDRKMPNNLFSADHIRQITEHGLTEAQVLAQIQRFKTGAAPIRLNRPCTAGDGIIDIPAGDLEGFVKSHDREAAQGRFMKFVPASGAASRMFKEWFRCLDGGCFDTEDAAHAFTVDIGKFAFYEDLDGLISRKGQRLTDWLVQSRHRDILAAILTSEGLNYGHLPKALLKFHTYPEGSRTAIEEHLVEAVLYVKDRKRICRIHFTVSGEHRHDVEKYLTGIRQRYEQQHDVHFDIDVSVQSADTDTIAVDMENAPFIDKTGKLVLRPGGHGALLSNLNQLSAADIIFLKNVDNIVPDHLKPQTVLYKKILSGYLITLQEQIFRCLEMLASDLFNASDLDRIVSFCQEKLNIVFPAEFMELDSANKSAAIFSKLNRPIRVCGMVKNEGEPGGGPFWVDEKDGTQSLQIVEESQVDPLSETQRSIWSSATHFSPVDLVCGIRDYRNRKYDLQQFVNQEAFSIVQKTEKGRDMRALELPGFWNGSMAYWITVFVEVPLETFNPVKTVYDLLRPAHQMGQAGLSCRTEQTRS
jgi:hypothetical protein